MKHLKQICTSLLLFKILSEKDLQSYDFFIVSFCFNHPLWKLGITKEMFHG